MAEERPSKEPSDSLPAEPSGNADLREAPAESKAGPPAEGEIAPAVSSLAASAKPSRPILTEKEFRRMKRREVLKLSPLILASAFVIDKFQQPLLDKGLAFSDWLTGALFSRSRLAPTYSSADVVPFADFPYNGYDVLDPDVDLATWKLKVEGLVAHPGEYTLEEIQRLPKITQNTRHICVEGWDVIGNFSGTRARGFLAHVGADPKARFLEVQCADDYYESIDMASILHLQTLLCYEMYGQPLDRGHGAPLRLQMPTKLGYKQAKYLTVMRVTNVLKPGKTGYWEDQGYSWFAGL